MSAKKSSTRNPSRNGQGQPAGPPFNQEAEEALIGSILINNQTLLDIVDLGLTPKDFYIQKLGWMFEAITELVRNKVKIDLVTLSDKLERDNVLANIGGAAELTRLLNITPSSLNGRYYAEIVKRDSLMRQALDYAGAVAQLAHSGQEAAEVISEIEAGAMDLVQAVGSDQGATLPEIGKNFIDLLEERAAQKGIVGLATGLTDLDRLLGGLKPRKVYTLAARPGLGKSSLAAQIAKQSAGEQQARCLFFSLEMDQTEIYTRLLSADSGVPGKLIDNATLTDEQWAALFEGQARLSNINTLKIIDDPALTLGRLRQEAISQWAKGGLDLLLVDYLQLMLPGNKAESRQAEVAALSRGLKVLAGQLNIPVIILSQLNRAVESRYDKKPQLSDLRESGAIEQDSDVVMFLYNPNADSPGLVNAYVAKHRGGETGERALFFRKEIFKFELAERQPPGSEPPPPEPEQAVAWQDGF